MMGLPFSSDLKDENKNKGDYRNAMTDCCNKLSLNDLSRISLFTKVPVSNLVVMALLDNRELKSMSKKELEAYTRISYPKKRRGTRKIKLQ